MSCLCGLHKVASTSGISSKPELCLLHYLPVRRWRLKEVQGHITGKWDIIEPTGNLCHFHCHAAASQTRVPACFGCWTLGGIVASWGLGPAAPSCSSTQKCPGFSGCWTTQRLLRVIPFCPLQGPGLRLFDCLGDHSEFMFGFIPAQSFQERAMLMNSQFDQTRPVLHFSWRSTYFELRSQ